jgi:hypothetical protein
MDQLRPEGWTSHSSATRTIAGRACRVRRNHPKKPVKFKVDDRQELRALGVLAPVREKAHR